MKRFFCCFFLVLLLTQVVSAKETYTITVLQVSKVAVFQEAYEGFMNTLKENGFVEGKNLKVTRHIIDADLDAGLWQKVGILFKIKSKASSIIDEKPDLVLTIGTPATKYSKDKFANAGIPMVFTGVANPVAAGCKTMTEAGPGCTGATIYIDPNDVMKIIKLAFPKMKTMGIVHCDDDNAIAFTQETKEKAAKQGIKIVSKEVGKSDKIGPAALELIKEGIDAFGIPPDSYYALRENEPSKDLLAITHDKKIPAIAFMTSGAKGCVLYVGPSLRTVGGISGTQAVKILKDGVKPEQLPVLRQEDLSILIDLEAFKNLNIEIPMQILELAKPFNG